MRTVLLICAAHAGVLLPPSAAQAPAPTPPYAAPNPAAVSLTKDLLVPLHSLSGDSDVDGEYGIWAAGPDYKASFHEGFSFHPVVGPDREHRSFAWHTESVRVGQHELAPGAGRIRYDDWRFERCWPEVVEAYDVRADGVEQTFTLPRRPQVQGALVITGRVSTQLTAPAVDAAQQALTFHDGDEALVRYGEAVAIDAAGRRRAVTTRFDGTRIQLRLSEEFLQSAAFPLVVDPLTSAILLEPPPSQFYVWSALTAQTFPTSPKVLVAFTRTVSSTDSDAFAMTADLDYSNPTLVYSDVTARWSTQQLAACYVGGSDHWVIASIRKIHATNLRAWVYIDQATGTTLNGGTHRGVPVASGSEHLGPRLGGSRLGQRALLLFTEFFPSTSTSVPRGVRIDVPQAQLQPQFAFSPLRTEKISNPRITPLAHTSSSWVVSLHSESTNGATSRLRVAKVPYAVSGTVSTTPLLTLAASDRFTNLSQGAPVAGSQDRYLLAYSRQSAGTCSLHSVRFDWPDIRSQPTILAERQIDAVSPCAFGAGYAGLELAYDYGTRSHWALVYPGYIARLGSTGAVTETQPLQSSTANVAFARPGYQGVFQVAHIGPTLVPQLTGQRFEFPSDAISAIYGPSCAAGVSVSTNRSYAGHEFYRVNLNGLTPQTLAIYALSFTQGSLDLTSQGLTGCTLNIGLPTIATLWAQTDANGQATVVYALPDAPLIIGDVHSQWFHVSPGANPANLLAYHGVRHQIR